MAVASSGATSSHGASREAGREGERVVANDNRRPAGRLRRGALTLRLEARVAMWHPDGDSAPGAPMPAFAEAGGPARIPGPLVRVPAGTVVHVTVKNLLRDTLEVHGLYDRPGSAQEPLTVPPAAERAARFRLGAAGTYHYWGTTTRRTVDFRTREDAQLTGAIVVDDPAAAPRPDRVFVIGMWTDTVHRSRLRRQRVLGVINGRSWPHTERIEQRVGDTVRWRVINASADLHPMHLHGFFFRVTRRGDEGRDSVTDDLVVTENMPAGGTMEMAWIPERPGNWLYHCHIPEHISPRGSLGMAPAPEGSGAAHGNHGSHGMNGLVMGVHVRPRATDAAATAEGDPATRHIRLLVQPRAGGSPGMPRYAYTLHEGGPEPPPAGDAAPTLDLTRGAPVRITIVNRLPDPTAIHWHGIELESYFDGVPGFSGSGGRVAPLIAPGDSFEVRFTPPRAGTFIYHTHADEERQQLAGLAGAIVVSEPGHPRNRARDIPIVVAQRNAPGMPGFAVDGRSPDTLELTAGVPHRLRFVQIDPNFSALRVELRRDTSFATWRLLAKDGADLPAERRVAVMSRVRLGIGETFDVEVTPEAGGTYRLEVRQGARYPLPVPVMRTLPIRVSNR